LTTSYLRIILAAIKMFLAAADEGYWVWVERASWVTVTVSLLVGLLAVAYQVRQLRLEQAQWSTQQAQLASELAKAPKLGVGYLADETVLVTKGLRLSEAVNKDFSLAATWPDSQDLSNPIEIPIYLFNEGDRSAKELDFEIRFSTGPVRGGTTETEDGITDINPDGSLRYYEKGLRLNPSSWLRFDFFVKVPRSLTEAKITLVGVMENYPNFADHLTIRFEYRGTSAKAVSAR
jgi:hypothetical protein